MSYSLNYRITISTSQGEVTWNFKSMSNAYRVFQTLKEGQAAQPCTVRLLSNEDNITIERFEIAAPKRPVNYQEALERLGGPFLLTTGSPDYLLVD